MEKKYVLGFLFSKDKKRVALIKKTKPDYQKGMLNGIGGKVEEFDKTFDDAMSREFEEEAGVLITDWQFFGSMIKKDQWNVFLFFTFSDEIDNLKSITEEIVGVYDVNNLPFNVMYNLNWLIPMAVTYDPKNVNLYTIIEQ